LYKYENVICDFVIMNRQLVGLKPGLKLSYKQSFKPNLISALV